MDANLGNRHYATYSLFYKREAAWWTSCLLPAKYSRLNFGVRLYTNPMFVHLLLTNVFRIDHTPNDRAQRFQLDSVPLSVNLLTPLRQAGLPLDGTSSDISGEPVLLLRRLLAATYLASHDCTPEPKSETNVVRKYAASRNR